MNSTRMMVFDKNQCHQIKEEYTLSQDSIYMLKKELDEVRFFSLETNEYAQDYLYRANSLDQVYRVKEYILSLNTNKMGNQLVPYDPIEGKPFLIDKLQFLNHRWIIANFTNGILWGEVFLKYFIKSDGTITVDRIETVLYPKF